MVTRMNKGKLDVREIAAVIDVRWRHWGGVLNQGRKVNGGVLRLAGAKVNIDKL